MPIDASRALGAYAAVTTLCCAWLALGGLAPARPIDGRFRVLDVERINVREADGTLRMTIANAARQPGVPIDGRETPHPNRTSAGIIFFNDEGFENGGLAFEGRRRDGKVVNGGSLTFDRYHQDQVVQLFAEEDGADRSYGVRVNDRPEGAMNFAGANRALAMTDPKAQEAALAAANIGIAPRGFFGRSPDGSARLDLRDAAGKVRLSLRVAADGAARIEFRDAAGTVTRTVTPDP